MMRAYKIVAFMFALYFAAVSLAHAGGHGGRMALEGPRTERWLAGLPPEQQQKARIILEEERPAIQELHYRIRCKMQELEGLNYDNDIRPDALSRLGWELQKLRDQLHDAYQRVHERMRQEVGVEFVRPGRRGCRSISQFNHM
ncbi:hypothetical protein [uncultured Desulfovibrio sp.]|uniref:hypothetical protein n=1 Tax=uncultured Desulfovibrio sp. TaxID=167968 RepID=UPI002621095F|nr:hypothetical protein [uncultured Desulfovibrio sp.]